MERSSKCRVGTNLNSVTFIFSACILTCSISTSLTKVLTCPVSNSSSSSLRASESEGDASLLSRLTQNHSPDILWWLRTMVPWNDNKCLLDMWDSSVTVQSAELRQTLVSHSALTENTYLLLPNCLLDGRQLKLWYFRCIQFIFSRNVVYGGKLLLWGEKMWKIFFKKQIIC